MSRVWHFELYCISHARKFMREQNMDERYWKALKTRQKSLFKILR